MGKRYRTPKPKPNTIELVWGKIPHCDPDIVTLWGQGCCKADSRLLMIAICDDTFRPGTFDKKPSLIKELENRGYDITTIRFSIKKKEAPGA